MPTPRILIALAVALFTCGSLHAEARVLDGHPVSREKAQSWCIAPSEIIPSWDFPAHPDCKMIWREVARHEGRALYSARYSWPAPDRGDERGRILTEVLFEGLPQSRVVRCLYAVQEDSSRILLAPLRITSLGAATVVESRICMTGTAECASELASWNGRNVERVVDHTIDEIRASLPEGYALKSNPSFDLPSATGRAHAWSRADADCCPSAVVEFRLRLTGAELHAEGMQVRAGS